MIYVNFVEDKLPALPPGARVNEYKTEKGATMYRIESEALFEAGLRGVVQHLHYTTLDERTDLVTRSRTELAPGNTAVLIPIRKSAEWWAMAHDQRGEHFHKKHTPTGAAYVERVFRKLYHARYLGSPYDFLTYFEFVPADAGYFRELLAELRATEEWKYVEEEFEVWLTKLS
jgi:chlorite dismutase